MRLHRFIINAEIKEGSMDIKNEDLARQLKSVFRLGVGDGIIISDGKGKEANAKIKSLKKSEIEFEIYNLRDGFVPEKSTTLYLALLKKENFELAVQKAVECGVSRMVPIITGRTVKLHLNMDRLRKIVREAAEQSGRADLPEVSEPQKFKEALELTSGTNLFFDERGEKINLFEYSSRRGEMSDGAVLGEAQRGEKEALGGWIGPEGGWTEAEIDMAKSAGFKIASLGKTTLRAETAAIVAAYLIVSL